MSFSTFDFILFLTVVTVVYYFAPKRLRWIVLLVASYTFYLFSGTVQIAYIAGTTLVTYISAILISSKRLKQNRIIKKNPEMDKEEKKLLKAKTARSIASIKTVAVILLLGALIAVKYLNFILESTMTIIGNADGFTAIDILVPLGISFYTFQSIGYILDVSRGKYEAETNLGKLALFVSFFPSIIQGPINRYDDVGKQLSEGRDLVYDNLTYGAQLIMWGFFKKLVIAERIAPVAGSIFAAYEKASGTVLFFGVLASVMNLYMDFSGGIDIARGAAQMLGIDLPENFQRPYFSQTVSEFWRRWHITLGAWMKDYVFYPIGLSKPVSALSKKAKQRLGTTAGKTVPSVIASFVVFFLMGIWHGASLQYLFYALYFAVVVSAEILLEPVYKATSEKLKLKSESFSWKLFRMVRTWILTAISLIIIGTSSLEQWWKIISGIFTNADLDQLFEISDVLTGYGLSAIDFTIVAVSFAIVILVSILQENGIRIREALAKQNVLFRWAVYIGGLALILVFGKYGMGYEASDFIYGKF